MGVKIATIFQKEARVCYLGLKASRLEGDLEAISQKGWYRNKEYFVVEKAKFEGRY